MNSDDDDGQKTGSTHTCRECGETFQKYHHLGMHYRIVHVWP